MIARRTFAAMLLLALAACATAPAADAPSSIYVMRHLQKGDGQDPGLSEEGRANAQRLVTLLERDPPAAIYVSATRRAQETAAPLAARLGLTAKTYDPRNTPGLVARVSAEPGNVLIVGHSNTVPDIVEQLGGTRPAALAETDYGDVWRISRADRQTTRLRIGR